MAKKNFSFAIPIQHETTAFPVWILLVDLQEIYNLYFPRIHNMQPYLKIDAFCKQMNRDKNIEALSPVLFFFFALQNW